MAKHMAVPTRQMMNGARMFLNILANTTGRTIEATHAMTVFRVDMSPATGAMAGSPMRVVSAGTM